MKRTTILIALAALMLAGCKHDKPEITQEGTTFACGIQSVVLPIFWLSKHVPLTPYAKRLFGPGSYIE